MQEPFVDKIYLFKFLSMCEKPWLDQLKVITRAVVVQASLNFSIGTRKGKYPVLRTNTKPQQVIKHTKISYSLSSLVLFYWTNFYGPPTEMV